jgi:hypothetical protein
MRKALVAGWKPYLENRVTSKAGGHCLAEAVLRSREDGALARPRKRPPTQGWRP